jgi:polar amino acid transport system permease protein
MIWSWSFALSCLPDMLRGLWVTLEAVFFGMLLALALGLVWALARRSASIGLSAPVAFLVEFVRSTPLLVQLYFIFYGLPALGVTLSPLLAGILALGVHYSCYTAEVYRAGIEGVARGQWEAATALNLTRRQTYRHVILPQAIPPIVPVLGNYLIAMFKDTPLLSAITVLEMLQRAKIIGKQSFRFLEPLTLVGAFYLALSLLSALAIGWLSQRLNAERT